MSVTVNDCINKCDYIQDQYNYVISKKHGSACNKREFTLCDLIVVSATVFTTSEENKAPSYTQDTIVTTNCNIILSQQQTDCSSLILTNL